jgi:hypothetical protein
MSEWSEASVLAYCAKNIVKVAAEAKSQQQKTDEAVQLVSNEIVDLSMELIELKQDSPEWLAIRDQIAAYRSVKTAGEATE